MRVTDKHVFFWGGVFSNWYPSPFVKDDFDFATAEQYFMFKKALYFDDLDTADLILNETNPSICKKLGRQVKNFDTDKWMSVCEDAMYESVKLKFEQNQDLMEELLKYKTQTFVEASTYDRIWGVGLGEDSPLIDNEDNWLGMNLLGKVLTKLRDENIK